MGTTCLRTAPFPAKGKVPGSTAMVKSDTLFDRSHLTDAIVSVFWNYCLMSTQLSVSLFFGLRQVLIAALGGYVRKQRIGKGADGHGLEDHPARAGDHGVKESFPAEEDILGPLDRSHVNGAGGVHHGQVARVHHDLLVRAQIVLHAGAIDLQKGHTPARELLHNEALAAEKAHHPPLLEEDGQLHPQLRAQKARLLDHDGPVRGDLHRPDGAGKAGGKGDHPLALGGVDILKDALPGKEPSDSRADAAAAGGLHVHVG